jgi:hypothetical protein
MSTRIDIELTSRRDDTFTWRAAGAKQPKGEIAATMLASDAKVGDVLRVDTERHLDGVNVIAVLGGGRQRKEAERIEIIDRKPSEDQLVTLQRAERGRGGGRSDRGDRGDRPDRPRGDRDRGPGGPGGDRGRRERRPDGARPEGRADGGDRSARPRSDRPSRPRTDRPSTPPAPAAPKPKRLRAGRTHRNAALVDLTPEQKIIADYLLRGGVPALRAAIDHQNSVAKTQGEPEVKANLLLAFAEQLWPRLRTAEWYDKAEAALAGVDELDLRDLRSVVVAADAAVRDDETRSLAEQLRAALNARVDAEQAKWLADIDELLVDGRTVRALRQSSRPPKAGSPLPTELAERLSAAASQAMTSDIAQDRWATLVDAVAFSPVRLQVTPLGAPANPGPELKGAVERVSSRVPQIAALVGITPASTPARAARPARPRRPGSGAAGPGAVDASGRRTPPPPPKPAVAPSAATPAEDGVAPNVAPTPAAATPAADAVATDQPSPADETNTVDTQVAEAVDEAISETVVSDTQIAEFTSSGDGADDAVVVQELGETLDEG